jgi:hypothetical protein
LPSKYPDFTSPPRTLRRVDLPNREVRKRKRRAGKETHHSQRDPTGNGMVKGEEREGQWHDDKKGRGEEECTITAVTLPYLMAPQILLRMGVLSSASAL